MILRMSESLEGESCRKLQVCGGDATLDGYVTGCGRSHAS